MMTFLDNFFHNKADGTDKILFWYLYLREVPKINFEQFKPSKIQNFKISQLFNKVPKLITQIDQMRLETTIGRNKRIFFKNDFQDHYTFSNHKYTKIQVIISHVILGISASMLHSHTLE